jgi:FK506-binding protein 2
MKLFAQIVLLGILCLSLLIDGFAEEKLQVLTTKKVADCQRRSKVGDTLYMQYTVRPSLQASTSFHTISFTLQGVLKSNGVKFDSSYDRGQPFVFKIGAGQAIRGWDQGLLE